MEEVNAETETNKGKQRNRTERKAKREGMRSNKEKHAALQTVFTMFQRFKVFRCVPTSSRSKH
jgi:hypothetical protein